MLKKDRLKDSKEIIIKDDKSIPYNQIENQDKITFVVTTKDETTLTKILKSIVKIEKEYKNKEIQVIISSSYEKLHKLTNGIL